MGASGTAMHHDMKVQSTLMIACYKAPQIHVRPIKEGKFSETSNGSCDPKPLDWEGWRKNWSPSHKLHKMILEYIGWFWMLLDWGGRAKNEKKLGFYAPCESANLYIDVYCISLNSVTIDGSPGHILYIIYRHMYGGFLKWGGCP